MADLARTGQATMAATTPGEYALAFVRSLGAMPAGGPNPVAALEADPAKATVPLAGGAA